MLAVEGLSFRYPDGRQALEEIAFRLEAGEKVGLLGPNGAGKSTLTLCLNGVLRSSGSIQLGGLRLDKSTLPQFRAKLGLVFQDPDDQLFCPTVAEDVGFAARCQQLSSADVAERVRQALEAVGLTGYAERIPQHLSGGEKKRAALATVLATQPEFLIIDEPSAGLDPRSRRQLIQLLQQLPVGMLIASHDLGLIEDVCPRALVLDQGKLVGDLDWADLREDGEFLRRHGLLA